MSARRALLPRLLLAGGVLLLGAEVAVRVDDWRAGRDVASYLPPTLRDQGMYVSHPYTGFALEPGYVRTGPYGCSINALGMRGKEMSATKPPGTFRILCLGGSTTFGTGATSDDTTYPARLERLLNQLAAEGKAPAGRTYEVGNCGVPGWTAVENLIHLQLRLVEYDPDAILVHDGVSDGRTNPTCVLASDGGHLRCGLEAEHLSATERFLVGHVRLYARLARGTASGRHVDPPADDPMDPDRRETRAPSNAGSDLEDLDDVRRHVHQMLTIARVHGIEPVLSTMAVRDPGARSGPARSIVRANELLRELATAEGVSLVDVGAVLSEQPRLFDDGVHVNDLGSLRHAQVVAGEALRQGLFGLADPSAAAPADGGHTPPR